jgi:hypothetical protein
MVSRGSSIVALATQEEAKAGHDMRLQSACWEGVEERGCNSVRDMLYIMCVCIQHLLTRRRVKGCWPI